eukprot:668140-Amphidinium_carterae.1
MSRKELVSAVQALSWLQLEAGADEQDLAAYWARIASISEDQVSSLLSSDLAEILGALGNCNRRDQELTRLLSWQCRKMARHFDPQEVRQVCLTMIWMGWRSRRTLEAMAQRVTELMRHPETNPAVSARHLRALVGAFPALRVGWRNGRLDPRADLDMWRAVANTLPGKMPA